MIATGYRAKLREYGKMGFYEGLVRSHQAGLGARCLLRRCPQKGQGPPSPRPAARNHLRSARQDDGSGGRSAQDPRAPPFVIPRTTPRTGPVYEVLGELLEAYLRLPA